MDTAIDLDDLFRFGSAENAEVESNEDQLIRLTIAGDDDAFRTLVEQHQEKIYHFCCQWLPDEEDAREATQDTFVRAYQAISRYRRRARFTSWLFRIALNLCRDRYKSKSARQRRNTRSLMDGRTGSELPCSKNTPDEAVASAGDLETLKQGIDSLPPKLQAVVIICGVEGMSQEVCAEILNISVRAVEGRFYRARKALEKWMQE